MPTLRAFATATALLTTAACHTWKPVPSTAPPDATIRVTYAAPRDVVATDSDGNSIRIAGVHRWEGTVVRAGADTLYVRMTSVSAPSTSLPTPAVSVALVREPGVTVTRRSTHVIKTVVAIWLGAGTIWMFVSPGDRSLW